MPRTLSGLQTGEFDEVDVLHTVYINGNPGGANQVLTSDGVNSNWNDIPSQLPAGLAGQVLTSAAGTNPSFSAIPSNQNQILTVDSNGPTFTNRSNLVGGNLLVDSVGKIVMSTQPTVTDLRATDFIGGLDANNKASLNNISNLQCDTITGAAPPVFPTGEANQILTVDVSGAAVFSARSALVGGNIEIDSENNKITLKETPTVISLLATQNIGGVSASSKANLVNINNLNCNSITCPAATISGVALGANLPNLTIQRTAGDKTYNGTIAVDVPAPKHLTVAHNGTDLLTYDPSATNNQAVNIDCKTLTMNVGATAYTYNTISDRVVNVPVILPGNNISLATPYANSQQVNVDIGASGLPTNGNDINLANDTYGGTSGDIVNVKSILMDANAGEIGSTSNLVNNIHAARIYVGQIGAVGAHSVNIYSDHVFATALYPINIFGNTWSNSAGNKANLLGSGGTRVYNLPTSQPVGSNTAGLLWNDQGTFKISS